MALILGKGISKYLFMHKCDICLTNLQLQRVKIGDTVDIEFYKNQKYVVKEGKITTIDIIKRKVILDGIEIISFFDMLKILCK